MAEQQGIRKRIPHRLLRRRRAALDLPGLLLENLQIFLRVHGEVVCGGLGLFRRRCDVCFGRLERVDVLVVKDGEGVDVAEFISDDDGVVVVG